MYLKFITMILMLAIIQIGHAQDSLKIGYITHDQPLTYQLNNEAIGIMPELMHKTLFKMDPNYKKHITWIAFEDGVSAEAAYVNNQLDFLLGKYSYADINKNDSGLGISIYNDPIHIVAKKKNLTITGLVALIWNDLLKKTLAYSLLLIILFTVVIYVLESDKHPQMKDSTRREAFSFTFFTITACFLRDLVYEPVTNAARFIYGAWMIISLFLITVITSVVTSIIIISTTDKSLRSLDFEKIKNQEIAYISAHHSNEILIQNINAKAKGYHSIKDIITNLLDENIYYAAIPESVLHSHNHEYNDFIIVSESPIGYESYNILISPKFKPEYISQLNQALVDTMLNENMYHLCSKYTNIPNHCNII